MSVLDITTYGADPAKADNTTSIQQALDAASPGDTVQVPAGTFMVDATHSLTPKSGTAIQLTGSLRAIPNSVPQSAVLLLSGVSNITISGPGSIVGERAGHLAPGPARGGGLITVATSTAITLNGGLWLTDSWSDGLYIEACKNVTVDSVICSHNSRNGLSIISVEGMKVTNSIFTLTSSSPPMPQSGIDIEPDTPTQPILDLSISGNQFLKNTGAGVSVAFDPGPNRSRIYIVQNTFDQHYKNGNGPPLGGLNSVLANILFATCRWLPWYDYWAYKSELTVP